MINYVNINSKRFVNRNNGFAKKPLTMEYDTVETLQFSFIDDNNQIQELGQLSGLALAVGLKQGKPSYDLLALSKDYTIEGNVIKFSLNTYTVNWLQEVKKNSTEAYIELSQQSLTQKRVMLRDFCYVFPRTYVEGLTPEEISSADYWTKEETQEAIDNAIESISVSGYVTHEEFEEALSEKADLDDVPTKTSDLENDSGFITEAALSSKQDVIDSDNKLAYGLLSGTPSIPTKTSDLQNDSGFITDSALADYQKKITAEEKLDYVLLSGTPAIPTKTSDLNNDSGFQTASDVQTAISGKADESELADYQKKITNDSKLAYSLLSGTPTIPSKTSDLLNDSGFITSDALSGKQDKITNDSRLDYGLLSGTPSIPTKTSDLTNDSGFATSGYVQQETSGKLTTPSGGTVGQVIKKTANGAEWADDFELNPTLVQIEVKTLGQDTAYTVDFTGKQIQKYVHTDATSGTVEIGYETFTSTANDIAPTIELHVCINGDVSTITLPSALKVIDIPTTLTYTGQSENDIQYEVFVLRAEKDMNGTWQYYINYAYSYLESVVS